LFINFQPNLIFKHPNLAICPEDFEDEGNFDLNKQTKEFFLQKDILCEGFR